MRSLRRSVARWKTYKVIPPASKAWGKRKRPNSRKKRLARLAAEKGDA